MQTTYRYIICTILTSLGVSQQLDISTLERLVIEQNLELLSNSKQIEIAKAGATVQEAQKACVMQRV